MQKRRNKSLAIRLTAQELALIAVGSSVLIWSGILHFLLT